MGFAPDLPDSNGDGFPRSQLSRLGKELPLDRDRYIEGFRIAETSIEDSKSRERKCLAALPLGHRDHGTEPLACPLRRCLEQTK